ncbi:hypothetical protein [Dethiosulfatarculus sandiegensis]|uniref:Type II secretion system protein GspG C-terminal domain-containing protein n=1 Tax=Dethiosulfatarculus sandiegensis TaxID=1429043 RepID=A0A0D2GDC7_9BACT|nr:hypothetical protein [Dethiosulfatarculus sandiegensis]KIX12952.1 hypothetical protein X474_16805 [Dethiosulfatarculus sandiegensis]
MKIRIIISLISLSSVLLWPKATLASSFANSWITAVHPAWYLLAGVVLLLTTIFTGFVLLERAEARDTLLAKERLAARQLGIIKNTVLKHWEQNGSFPENLIDVGLSPRLCTNPWGLPYNYELRSEGFAITTQMPDRLVDFPKINQFWSQKEKGCRFACPGQASKKKRFFFRR